MSIKHIARCTALAATLALAGTVHAAPITYVHTGSGSGTLNGVAFGALAPVSFTINATADTDNLISCGAPCLSNDNLTASITIDSLGTFDFITATRFFANGGIVGFSRAGTNGWDLFNGPAVASWDMTSSLGPVSGSAQLIQWSLVPVNTTGGVLVFDNNLQVASTFTATVGSNPVPEPTPLALLGAAVLALSLRRRSSH